MVRHERALGVHYPLQEAACKHLQSTRVLFSPGGVYGRKDRGWLDLYNLRSAHGHVRKASSHLLHFNGCLGVWIMRTQLQIPGLSWPQKVRVWVLNEKVRVWVLNICERPGVALLFHVLTRMEYVLRRTSMASMSRVTSPLSSENASCVGVGRGPGGRCQCRRWQH